MKLELISFKICPFVQRSIITLNYKGLPYDITYIELDNPPDWFLKISPFGKVPVLRVDNETVLFESAIINEYVDDVTPGTLKPGDPLLLANSRAWIAFGEQCLYDQYDLMIAKTEDAFDDAADKALMNLHKVEDILGDGPYFNGADFSLVDAAYAPLCMRYALLNERHTLFAQEELPKFHAWSDALQALDAIQRSVEEDFNTLFFDYIERHGDYAASVFA